MGIWARLRGQSLPETRDAAFTALSRALGEQYANGYSQPDRLAAVAACVRLISASISSLPVSLTVDGTAGREPAPASASAWALIRRPGPRHSWSALLAWIVRELLLQGNAVCQIMTDGAGQVIELRPIPWAWLSPEIAGGRLVYTVWNRHPEAQLLGIADRLLDSEVIHFRQSDSGAGFIGQSVLSRARGPVTEGMEIEKLAAANWRNGARPSAALSLETFLDDNRRKRFETETIPALIGGINAGKMVVLEGGMKFLPLSMNSVDSQFIETRQLNTEQICALFGVPSILIQTGQRLASDMAPFVTQFAQLALAPIVTAIQSEVDHVLLPHDMHCEIDLDGLGRGSFATTVAALAALLQSGAVTPNNVRAELKWPPIDGGDTLRVGSPPSWPADGPGSKHLGASPGPTGSGVPEPGTNQNGGSG